MLFSSYYRKICFTCFKKNFLRKIQTLLSNQESCMMNKKIITYYFKLKKQTHQGDPTPVYLLILVLEDVFCVIKSRNNIKALNIFNYKFLYTYRHATFFFNGENSVFKILSIFHKFTLVSGLKTNPANCQI